MSARAIAEAVRAGRTSALAVAEQALARVAGDRFGAMTRVLCEPALAAARAVDATIAAGGDPGPLAGVPFGVKDLFDVAGLPTTAGAASRADAPPAAHDAKAVARLKRAGAILVATLNMDEFAYGFATVNAHHGTTRNPHAPDRLAGGSSGGSAAAVAGGLLPLALGSDTNGSIRVPAGLCGVYGLKPTHGSLPMDGVYPFVESFDDIGPFATDVADLRLVSEVLRGAPYEEQPAPERIALLGGWFAAQADDATRAAIARLALAIGAGAAELPAVDAARSAAFLMTAHEGGNFHLPALRDHAMAYDPATRDRLIAGAMLDPAVIPLALRVRRWFAGQAARLFERWDVLLAPATPAAAPLIDDPMIEVGGARLPARANLGMLTQPLSFIGLPVIAAPLADAGPLPIGVQLIGPPGGEALLFALAAHLEAAGLTCAWPPPA